MKNRRFFHTNLTVQIKMTHEEIKRRKEAYQRILSVGLLAIRDRATTLNSVKIAEIEADHLHNIPSLLEETNEHRHIFYAHKERNLYLQRIRDHADQNYLDYVVRLYQEPWEILLKSAIAAQEAINQGFEQVGTGQPAARPESKSEGQPETERHSR